MKIISSNYYIHSGLVNLVLSLPLHQQERLCSVVVVHIRTMEEFALLPLTFNVLRKSGEANESTKFLILTSVPELIHEQVYSSYVINLKDSLKAISKALLYLSAQVPGYHKTLEYFAVRKWPGCLTLRECEFIGVMVRQDKVKDIALTLDVSEKTTYLHLSRIKTKLNQTSLARLYHFIRNHHFSVMMMISLKDIAVTLVEPDIKTSMKIKRSFGRHLRMRIEKLKSRINPSGWFRK